ncbi:MAG: aminotransferase class III-fold pyridoxal phosphate-dependent enzyme [Actinomycetota bacterium]
MTNPPDRLPPVDGPVGHELWDRADAVLPGGVLYLSRSADSAGRGVLPGFIASGDGCRVTDVDGKSYIDFLCANGPILLGYHHPEVDAAAAAQAADAHSSSLYPPVLVDFAERLVERTDNMAWAVAAKNGSDAVALALRAARVATGASKVIQFESAYHGFAPELVPVGAGVTEAGRADVLRCGWNDASALLELADGRSDIAAIVLNPVDQSMASATVAAAPDFLAAIEQVRAATGAKLVFDDVRHGFRIHPAGSHVAIGVEPDLVCLGKALGNGHAISALLGTEELRSAASQLWFTATFCFEAVAMRAAIATVDVYERENAFATIDRSARRLRDGILGAAERTGHRIDYTGPPATPSIVFADDPRSRVARRFAAESAHRGALFHPTLNWFVSAGHDDSAIDEAIAIAAEALAATPPPADFY